MENKFKNHNFENATEEQGIFAICKYCEKTYLDCTDKHTGMVGECSIGQSLDERLDEEAILLAKAIRLLRQQK
jgi:hypothetical protein